MIKFEPAVRLEPVYCKEIQWGPAIGAGFVAGIMLLLVPRGSPWEALTFFSPAILGRTAALFDVPLMFAWLIHLIVSLIYGLVVSRTVAHLKFEKGLLAGGIAGLVLYVVNFGVVSAFWPNVRGNEFAVLFTHVVFGLLAAGAYRGLLRRKAPASPVS